jgi:hypothetical protein
VTAFLRTTVFQPHGELRNDSANCIWVLTFFSFLIKILSFVGANSDVPVQSENARRSHATLAVAASLNIWFLHVLLFCTVVKLVY